MFSLHEFTKVKILDVSVLSSKNRPPGANPGVRLHVQAELPNDVLSYFDGALRGALFTKSEAAAETAKDKRQTLPGVEPISDLTDLTAMARHMGKIKWSEEMPGYTMTIDFGLGGKSNLMLDDATLDRWRFAPKKGGTVLGDWLIERTDVPTIMMGELTVLKSREVLMSLREPEITQQDLADPGASTHWPFPNAAPGSAEEAENKKAAAKGGKGKKDQLTPEKALADSVGAASE